MMLTPISAAHEIGLHRNPESNTADTVEGTIENIWRAELSKRVWINLLIWDGYVNIPPPASAPHRRQD